MMTRSESELSELADAAYDAHEEWAQAVRECAPGDPVGIAAMEAAYSEFLIAQARYEEGTKA